MRTIPEHPTMKSKADLYMIVADALAAFAHGEDGFCGDLIRVDADFICHFLCERGFDCVIERETIGQAGVDSDDWVCVRFKKIEAEA